MKELNINLDASSYIAQLDKITKGYEKLSKSMLATSKTASDTVSTTRSLEDAQRKLTDLETKSLQLAKNLADARAKVASSRSEEGKAIFRAVVATQEEVKAVNSAIAAKKADSVETKKAIEADIARVKTLKDLTTETARNKAAASANVKDTTANNKDASESAKLAAEQRLTNTRLVGIAQVDAANKLSSAKIQTEQAKQTVYAGRTTNARLASIATIDRAQAKANQTALQNAGLYAQKLTTIGLQQQKITSATALIDARRNAVLAKQNAMVEKQLISWQSIQRVIVGQLTFRAVTLGIHELTEAYDKAKAYTQSIAEIQTISQSANITSQQWSESLREVSNATGINALNVSEAAYQSLSNQVTHGAETFQFLQVASGLAKAGVTDLSTSVDIITSALNSYNLGVESAEEVAAAYFKTIELGRVRAEDLKSVMGTLEVFGAKLGITFQELGATIATMTNQGITATKAGTQLRSLMTTLIKPTEDLKQLFAEWGVSTGEAAIATFGWEGVLARLASTTKESSGELGKLIHNQRALIGALVLTGPALDTYRTNLEKIKDSSDSYAEAQRIVAENSTKVINDATNRFNNFMLRIGESSVDGFAALIGSMKEVNRSFESLFVAGSATAGILVLTKLSGILTTVAADFAVYTSRIVAGTSAQIVSFKLLTAAEKEAATGAELAASRGKAAFSSGIYGVAILGIAWLIERTYAWSTATDEAVQKLKDANEEWLKSTDRSVRVSGRLFDKSVKDIVDNATRSTRIIRLTSDEAYKSNLAGWTKITSALDDKLQDVVSKYRRSLEDTQKSTELAIKQASNALSLKIGNEATNLSVAIAKLRGEGADVKREKDLAKLEIDRQKVVRDYEQQQSALRLAERSARKNADSERLADLRKQRVADNATFKERLASIDLEKKEIADKAQVEEKVLKAYEDNATRIRATLSGISTKDEEGLNALKARTAQYEGAVDALAQQYVAAGKYGKAEALNEVVIKDRQELFTKIAKAETALADKKAKENEDREKKITAVRLAAEQLLAAAKLNNSIIEDKDFAKRKEHLEEIIRLYKEIAINSKIAGPESGLPVENLASNTKAAETQLKQQSVAIKGEEDLARIVEAAQKLREERSRSVAAYNQATAAQADYTAGLEKSAKALDAIDPQNKIQKSLAKILGATVGLTPDSKKLLNVREGVSAKDAVTRVASAGVDVTDAEIALARKKLEEAKTEASKLTEEAQGPVLKAIAELENFLEGARVVADAQLRGAALTAAIAKDAAEVSSGQVAVSKEGLVEIRSQTTALQELTKALRREPLAGAGYQTGGAVKYFSRGGGPRGTDTVPAWLTPGEFVVNRSATSRNRQLLEAINNNNFAGTSRPMSEPKYYSTGGSVSNSNTTVGNISISMNASGDKDYDIAAIAKGLNREIRRGRVNFANN